MNKGILSEYRQFWYGGDTESSIEAGQDISTAKILGFFWSFWN